jgi:aspartate racemase
VALFGTKFTMQGGFYDDVLSEQGIEIIKPDTDDQNYIHEKYMGEFVKGVFRENTRMELLNIVNRLRQRDHIEGLILGGTELPFILKKDTITDIHVFDTTEIHIDCVVKLLN